MEIPIMLGALVFGVVFILLSLAKVGKTKKTGKMFLYLGLLGLGVAGLAYAGIGIPQTYTYAIAPPTPTPTPTPTPGVCPPGSVEDVTVKLSAIDKYTSLATGGTHAYKINGAPTAEVSNSGTFTASAGATLQILWYNASTTDGYFSDVSKTTLSCSDGAPVLYRELVSNGTVTLDVFNEDGNKIDSANNETLGAGDVTTLEAKLKGTYQKGLPYGGLITCRFNNTDFDDCMVDFGGVEVNVPSVESSITGTNVKAYSFQPILSNDIIYGKITIDVKTNNPSPVPSAALNITVRPYNYFINEDTGGSFDGPAAEDEDDTATIPAQTQTDIFVA